MSKMKIAGIERNSLVDGPGIRTVIYFSGCSWNCTGCHAKDLQDFKYGKRLSSVELFEELIEDIEFVDGITLSGGDPVFQIGEIKTFIKLFKTQYPDKTIMMYTGFELYAIEQQYKDVLSYIDYIMDGKFDIHLPTSKKYRGSDNQKYYKREEGEWTLID